MARDISELGADVFDDTPKKKTRFTPKQRNYIIGLSITGVLLAGAVVAAVVLCNTALTDYSNVTNVMYYFTPETQLKEGEKPTAVLYKLPSDVKFSSTFRIPSQVKGYKVIGVAERAFASHSEIKKVVMPNTIEFVGEEAFVNCTNLGSFTWSKNLTDVGVNAFENTKFYQKLLEDDKGLYDLPSGVLIYAGKNYFDNNTALVSDKLSDSDIANIKANYTVSNVKRFSELNVKSICSGAFKDNAKITYIDLPETLDEISNSTFEGCKKLEAIDGTHSKLTEIGKRAFANCEELKSINLPQSLKKLGNEAFANVGITNSIPDLSKIESVGEGIFSGCTKLTSVVFKGNKVTNSMFANCSRLASITWGEGNANIDNVTEIGANAFQKTAFTSFTLPKNVLEINDYVFEGCTSLESVYLYGNFGDTRLDPNGDSTEEGHVFQYVDHNGDPCDALLGIQTVKEAAFKGCRSLSTIKLYDDDYDHETALSGNDNEFTFPYSLMRCDGSSAGNLSHYPFTNTVPTKVTFSPNMKHIGSYAFKDVTTLTEVKIEQLSVAKLLSIKTGAFKGCTNLVTFELPNTVQRIEGEVFSGCASLANYSVANTAITAINAETYYNCQSITSLRLPDSVTSIKKNAFYRTYSLEYVIISNKVTEVLDNAFTQCRETEGDTMDVYICRTLSEVKKVNFGKRWHDATVIEYYFLGEGEQRIDGVHYWQLDGSGNPQII